MYESDDIDKKYIFDLIAFKLKEGNLFNLTKMVYESKYPEGFTDRFNNLLLRRIREIKANDFSLLQTAGSTYRKLAQKMDVLNSNKVYSVYAVYAEDIPNFYALAHTPETGFVNRGSRDANFANFKLFEMIGDDKVICTGYITAEKAGLVKNYHHGFIFEVPNDKQYVGYGTDIFSLSKNIPDMIVEYYRDRGYKANKDRGDKWAHRTFISKALKRELYGIVGSKLKSADDKYIARLDNIKEKLGDKPLTLENLQPIDPEFAKAYERAINSKGWNFFHRRLLKEFVHNEVLVSNPKISAIFTDNIDELPVEYLIKAQEENIPIVIIGHNEHSTRTTTKATEGSATDVDLMHVTVEAKPSETPKPEANNYNLIERINSATSRQELDKIRDEINKLQDKEEKEKLYNQYRAKYQEISANRGTNPNIVMQYTPESKNTRDVPGDVRHEQNHVANEGVRPATTNIAKTTTIKKYNVDSDKTKAKHKITGNKNILTNINNNLQIFKSSNGENIFSNEDIDAIKNNFNEKDQKLFNDIIEKFVQKYKSITEEDIELAEHNPLNVISIDLRMIIKCATSEELVLSF